MQRIPHPIPYQGSKRRLASQILTHVPCRVGTFYEPFCGSAALSLALAAGRADVRLALNDSLAPLAALWQCVIDSPSGLADDYAALWHAQASDARAHYVQVRAAWNVTRSPAALLYLLARCVKSAVRFNAAGEFNQSADHRRLGTAPARVRAHLMAASRLLAGRTLVTSGDYASATADATSDDLVYLDPPYQGTSGARDPRYFQVLDRERFVSDVADLVARRVPLIISFDGRTGSRVYGPPLPSSLGLVRLELHAGRSSQSTLLGKDDETFESLYLTPSLLAPTISRTRAQGR